MVLSDYNKRKLLNVTESGDNSVTNTVFCLKIISGNDNVTGTGEIVLDWSDISDKKDISVYDKDDNLVDYYFESFDITNKTAVIWVYKNLVRDGSVQLQVAYGDGVEDLSVDSTVVFGNETGLRAGYLFNETSGDLVDVSGNGNDCVVQGAVQGEDGIVGGAYYFDGVDDVAYTDNIIIDNPTSITISGWFRFKTGSSGYNCVLYHGENSSVGSSRYWMGKDKDDYLVGTIGASSGGGWDIGKTNIIAEDETWYFLVCVWNGSSGNVYVDNVFKKSYGLNSYGDLDTPTIIGGSHTGDGNYDYFANADVDNIRIYNKDLSTVDIGAFYDSTKSSPTLFEQQPVKHITGNINDYYKLKRLNVASIDNTPSVNSAVCIRVVDGDESVTGTGDIVIDWSDINDKKDIAVYDKDDNLVDYYFESFDLSEKKAVIWVYNEWVRDGSVQLQLAYGYGIVDDQSVDSTIVFTKEHNLEFAYLLNEDSGDVIDVSGNNNNGLVYGVSQGVEGIVGKGVLLDGENDYIDSGFSPISTDGSWSFGFWFYQDSDSGSWSIGHNSDDDVKLYIGTAFEWSLGDSVIASSPSINSDKWHYAFLIGDGYTANAYLNSEHIGSSDYNWDSNGDLNTIILGAFNNPNVSGFLKGKLDDVRLYSTNISFDNMKAKYDSSKEESSFFYQEESINNYVVSTLKASEIDTDSAKLNGFLSSMRGNTFIDVYFEWGENNVDDNTTPVKSLYETDSYSETLEGLEDGTTYIYRAVATDGVNIWYGENNTFTTEIDVKQLTDYKMIKKLTVTNDSEESNINSAVCIRVVDGDESVTGTGDIVIDWSDINDKKDIGLYNSYGGVLDYYFESFDITNKTAVIWVYNEWVRDGSVQLQVAYGDGVEDLSVDSTVVFGNETGLRAGYLFNETSGDLVDVSGNNNNGFVYGASQGEDGIVGGAYYFDGVDDVAEINNNILIDPTGITIYGWVKKIGDGGDYECVLHNSSDRTIGKSSYWFGFDKDDNLVGTIGANTGLGWNAGKTDIKVELDKWYLFMIIWDGFVVKFYINNELEKEYDLSYYNTINKPTHIGANTTGSTDYHLNGIVDDIRIYDVFFNDEERNAIYDVIKPNQTFFNQQEAETSALVMNVDISSFSILQKTKLETINSNSIIYNELLYNINSNSAIITDYKYNLNTYSSVYNKYVYELDSNSSIIGSMDYNINGYSALQNTINNDIISKSSLYDTDKDNIQSYSIISIFNNYKIDGYSVLQKITKDIIYSRSSVYNIFDNNINSFSNIVKTIINTKPRLRSADYVYKKPITSSSSSDKKPSMESSSVYGNPEASIVLNNKPNIKKSKDVLSKPRLTN